MEPTSFLQGTPISFGVLEVKTSAVNVCIIDDCKDADVPLLELTLRRLSLKHGFGGEGEAATSLSGNYYNRALSAWEPFMEPWLSSFVWRMTSIGQAGRSQKLTVNMTTDEVVNFNLTSTLVELYQMVKANWTEDYYQSSQKLQEILHFPRQRAAFVPYALQNDTGCKLWFATQTKDAGSSGQGQGEANFGPGKARFPATSDLSLDVPPLMPEMSPSGSITWKCAEPGETIEFTFEENEKAVKLRHLNSHNHKIHQVVVKVHGWREVTPVSVDKVGTFFRAAASIPHISDDLAGRDDPAFPMMTSTGGSSVTGSASAREPPPARLVFDVSLEGSARKLVTVRSALQVTNLLPQAVDLRLENTVMKIGDVREMLLESGQTRPIPLPYVWSSIKAKPSTGNVSSWKYCDKPINWYHIMTSQDNSLEVHTSAHGWNQKADKYRFCVAVKRQNYPLDVSSHSVSGGDLGSSSASQTSGERLAPSSSSSSSWIQPAHSITFISPVVVVNLLPCNLSLKHRRGEISGNAHD